MLLLGDISVYEKLYNHRIEMQNLLGVNLNVTPKDDEIVVYAGGYLEGCKITASGIKAVEK